MSCNSNSLHRTFSLLNVLTALMLTGGMIWFMSEGGLSVKAAASSCFVLMGAVNFIYALYAECRPLAYPAIMLVGLVFAMLGDVLLGYNFILGAGLFAVGHIFYIAAFCTQMKPIFLDIIVSTIVFAGAICLLTFYDKFDFGGTQMFAVCMIYALIISCMVGKAISTCIARCSVRNVLAAVGAAFFFFSDVMLVLRFFADAPWIADRLCLGTYFPAQGMLALSVFFHVRQHAIDK